MTFVVSGGPRFSCIFFVLRLDCSGGYDVSVSWREPYAHILGHRGTSKTVFSWLFILLGSFENCHKLI